MKKLLIIGAGVEQVPAIEIAKAMGHYVIVTDMSADAPGMKMAHKNLMVSTRDSEGNIKVAKGENVDGVMTLCSETAVPTVADVAEALSLPGVSKKTALAATNKGFMREMMDKAGVRMAAYQMIDNKKSAIEFVNNYTPPWVIKPSDSSGQRGTTFTSDKTSIKDAFDFAQKYSTDNKVLIDQFISGPEINVTALVINEQIKILSLSNRVTLSAPHFGIAARHIAPVNLSQNEIEAIKDMAVKSVKAIEMKNGIAYPQIINNENGPHLIEIAARIPGGHMRDVAMHLSGIDMIKTTIWQALGEPLSFEKAKTETAYPAISIFFITKQNINSNNAVIKSISGIEQAREIPGIVNCYIRLKSGDCIPKLESSVGRFGAVIAVGKSRNEALNRTRQAVQKIRVNNAPLVDYNNYYVYDGK